ncbi:DUF1207 domain-containing protein [Marinicella sediminis]|uniref:DUF1207 domain-containing protein n=2 Tax=Marinicella sediminis TaxID=1792834 RepID=A0ABV7JDI5_9GAMM|nr:DUF1207 domain-containing protein [Marinicella sediminis]
MKTHTLLCLLLMPMSSTTVLAESSIEDQLNECQGIEDSTQRLSCYDNISARQTAHIQQPETRSDDPKPSAMPPFLADLNEPAVFVSFGELDFLGNQPQAVLLGIGKRQAVKSFDWLDDRPPLTFNIHGLIRSQFDVEQLDTRNNRGGALINTDFAVGGELVQTLNNWNWRLSYTHRSTHLGDEFLLDNPEFADQRINLSYETIQWQAHKPFGNWDIYAGLGLITRSEPGDLSEVMWQTGWQYQGTTFADHFKPLWAVDLTTWGAYDWNININMRAGVEIANLAQLPIQVYFEYFDGHSPYGQFYTEDLSYAGITIMQHW